MIAVRTVFLFQFSSPAFSLPNRFESPVSIVPYSRRLTLNKGPIFVFILKVHAWRRRTNQGNWFFSFLYANPKNRDFLLRQWCHNKGTNFPPFFVSISHARTHARTHTPTSQTSVMHFPSPDLFISAP